MSDRTKDKTRDQAQSQRFIETARELEADEDEKAFAEKLKRIAKPKKPQPGSEES